MVDAPLNASRSACIATSFCTIPEKVWNIRLPAQLTVHLVVATAHAHQPSSSWFHDAVTHGTLDCSDIVGESDAWALKGFDPIPDAPDVEADAEVLLLLADIPWMSRGTSSRRMLAPCASPSSEAMARHGVQMMWLGSYRRDPAPIELSAVLRALSPRSAVVLGGGGDSATASADSGSSSKSLERATRFLQHQLNVPRRRLLVLPTARAGRRRRTGAGALENTRDVLQLAATLAQPDWETRSRTGEFDDPADVEYERRLADEREL